jgi:BirA family biotin operon repressor/biotin-[acetyl-CoA-carboxylase] ligase
MSGFTDSSSIIGKNVIRLESVHSTNEYLSELTFKNNLAEGTAVLALEQTQGRGQKGTIWKSESGKNLMVSFLLYPNFLLVSDQFLLSKILALSVLKTLQKFLPETAEIKIKWPNDIYVNNYKISGILIENSIQNSKLRQSIIGIGININQVEFPPEFNAISLMNITQKETEIELVFEELCININQYYSLLKSAQLNRINESYQRELYQLNEWKKFKYTHEVLEARITGVDSNGKLQLIKKNDQRISADLKEIIFVREL